MPGWRLNWREACPVTHIDRSLFKKQRIRCYTGATSKDVAPVLLVYGVGVWLGQAVSVAGRVRVGAWVDVGAIVRDEVTVRVGGRVLVTVEVGRGMRVAVSAMVAVGARVGVAVSGCFLFLYLLCILRRVHAPLYLPRLN